MKILGIGVDMVKISRFENILNASYKQRLIVKVLHKKEIETFNKD